MWACHRPIVFIHRGVSSCDAFRSSSSPGRVLTLVLEAQVPRVGASLGEVHRGVDQRNMEEGLGEIAQLPTGHRVVLLSQQPDVPRFIYRLDPAEVDQVQTALTDAGLPSTTLIPRRIRASKRSQRLRPWASHHTLLSTNSN
jgi:hypothetical protein